MTVQLLMKQSSRLGTIMEQENSPDYGYSHVYGYNKMNKETFLFSSLSLHVNTGGRGGSRVFQFDSLNNNNNNNHLRPNLGSFSIFPPIDFD